MKKEAAIKKLRYAIRCSKAAGRRIDDTPLYYLINNMHDSILGIELSKSHYFTINFTLKFKLSVCMGGWLTYKTMSDGCDGYIVDGIEHAPSEDVLFMLATQAILKKIHS